MNQINMISYGVICFFVLQIIYHHIYISTYIHCILIYLLKVIFAV